MCVQMLREEIKSIRTESSCKDVICGSGSVLLLVTVPDALQACCRCNSYSLSF